MKRTNKSDYARQTQSLIETMKMNRLNLRYFRINALNEIFDILAEMNAREKNPEQHFKIIDAMKMSVRAMDKLKGESQC